MHTVKLEVELFSSLRRVNVLTTHSGGSLVVERGPRKTHTRSLALTGTNNTHAHTHVRAFSVCVRAQWSDANHLPIKRQTAQAGRRLLECLDV